MSAAGLAKATIVKLDKQNRPVQSESVKAMFNPKELTFTKNNTWNQGELSQTNVPDIEFGGGGAATLTLELFFDTYAERKDVRKYTDAIHKMMLVDEQFVDPKTKKGRPPTVRFQWGQTVGFDAVITSVTQRFTLFLPDDGMPVRAVVNITFQQVRDALFYPRQNPTSGGAGGERVYTVKQGDTLTWIAFNEYNDATQWRRIADVNELTEVRRLIPGAKLVIPYA
jgi:hypothetical protein